MCQVPALRKGGGEKHGYWQESFAVLTSKKIRNSPSRQEGVRSTVGSGVFELLSSSNSSLHLSKR